MFGRYCGEIISTECKSQDLSEKELQDIILMIIHHKKHGSWWCSLMPPRPQPHNSRRIWQHTAGRPVPIHNTLNQSTEKIRLQNQESKFNSKKKKKHSFIQRCYCVLPYQYQYWFFNIYILENIYSCLKTYGGERILTSNLLVTNITHKYKYYKMGFGTSMRNLPTGKFLPTLKREMRQGVKDKWGQKRHLWRHPTLFQSTI